MNDFRGKKINSKVRVYQDFKMPKPCLAFLIFTGLLSHKFDFIILPE
jgi:hypothetical protein